MRQSKGFYLAAAPVAFLLLFGIGARFLNPAASDAAAEPQNSAPAKPLPPPEPVDAATQRLLEKAVGGQVAAIRKKDFAAALRFAAGSYRSVTNPEQFGQMVQAGFAPMIVSVRTTFTSAQRRDDLAALPATVVDKAGATTKYLYVLVKEGKGWAISSCQPLTPPAPHPQATPSDEREI